MLQTHARNYLIAIDKLAFKTTVLTKNQDLVYAPPKTGVYVRGLHLQGARWDSDAGSLVESNAGELFTEMPTLWLEPIEKEESTKKSLQYDCPVYKTTSRAGALSTTGISTNFVMSVQLNIGIYKSEDHWIQRGVALLLETD
ncbi:Dynein heavy chain and region D6 of dynein motor [compost metagenome]